MWRRSFVATAVALGDSVDDAVAAIDDGGGDRAAELVVQLKAPQRAARANALAAAVRDVVVAIDGFTLQ